MLYLEAANAQAWMLPCLGPLPCRSLMLHFSSPVYYEGLQDKLAQIRDARGALNALRDEHREKLRRAAEEAERQRQIQLAQKLEIMRQKKQVRQGSLFQMPHGGQVSYQRHSQVTMAAVPSLCPGLVCCWVAGGSTVLWRGWSLWGWPWCLSCMARLLMCVRWCRSLQEYLEMQRQLAIQRLQEQEKERQMRLEQQKQTIQMRAQMPAFSLPYAQVQQPCQGALP